MNESERRELSLPEGSFEFTEDGELVVRSERLADAFRDAGVRPGSPEAAAGEVSVGVVVSRSF